MPADHAFHVGAKVALRLGLIVLVVGVLFVAFLVASRVWDRLRGEGPDGSPKRHQIGTVGLLYDARAKCVVETKARATVLDSGLVDGRGLALSDYRVDERGNKEAVLYVADAWEGVYTVNVDTEGRLVRQTPVVLSHTIEMCPGGHCEQADYGGLIIQSPSRLVLSDANRQQLLLRQGTGMFEPAIGGSFLRRVRDVAWAPERSAYFVVHSEPLPQNASEEKRTGEVTRIPYLNVNERHEPIIKDLRRPVGVAWSARTNRLYVADLEQTNEVWSYFVEGSKGWEKGGTLWRQELGPFAASIRLQDIVVADFDHILVGSGENQRCEAAPEGQRKDEVVISAGPDGIYFFHSDGSLLSKYYLGQPVAGLTWGPAETGFSTLYFTSGPRIGALKTRLRKPASPPPNQPDVQSGDTAPNTRPTTTPTTKQPGNRPAADGPSPTSTPRSPPPIETKPPPPPPILIEILFAFDKDEITPVGAQALERARDYLQKRPDANVAIEGHADSLGTDAYNLALSDRRARAVEKWLNQHNVKYKSVDITPHGEARPVNRDPSEAGRRFNRRAIIAITP